MREVRFLFLSSIQSSVVIPGDRRQFFVAGMDVGNIVLCDVWGISLVGCGGFDIKKGVCVWCGESLL